MLELYFRKIRAAALQLVFTVRENINSAHQTAQKLDEAYFVQLMPLDF